MVRGEQVARGEYRMMATLALQNGLRCSVEDSLNIQLLHSGQTLSDQSHITCRQRAFSSRLLSINIEIN